MPPNKWSRTIICCTNICREKMRGSHRERPRCLSCIHAACKRTVVTPKPRAESRCSVNSEIPNALRKCAPVRCAAPTALYRVSKSTLKCQIISEQVSLCLIPGPNWSRKLKSKIRVRSTQSLKTTHLPCRAVNPSMPGFFGVKGGTMFHAFSVFTCSGAVRVIQISQ